MLDTEHAGLPRLVANTHCSLGGRPYPVPRPRHSSHDCILHQACESCKLSHVHVSYTFVLQLEQGAHGLARRGQ